MNNKRQHLNLVLILNCIAIIISLMTICINYNTVTILNKGAQENILELEETMETIKKLNLNLDNMEWPDE